MINLLASTVGKRGLVCFTISVVAPGATWGVIIRLYATGE
jgi:hypothetical protein